MFDITQYIDPGAGAATIAAKIESAIADGLLAAGQRLPTVRDLAAGLRVSPATVAAAYRTLNARGLVSANTRLGTTVTAQPPLRVRGTWPLGGALPANVRDLTGGNPDPALLPPLGPALALIDTDHKRYGTPTKLPRLVELAHADFAADGIIAARGTTGDGTRGALDGSAADIAIVGGALDGIERVLLTQLRPGDSVVIEDPGWPRIYDLIRAVGQRPQPVLVDQRGLIPAELDRALRSGAKAVIVTPRGQNPTGAAIDPDRGSQLCELLGGYPGVLVIEDDYVAAVAGAPYVPVHAGSPRWIVIRSLSKVLGPDLRIAAMAGDPLTIGQVEGRQLLGAGWVSHLLQQTAAQLWSSPQTTELLSRARQTYARRRTALVDALARHGIAAHGETGLGVWVPIAEETVIVQHLLERGWAVSPGERFRHHSPAAIRITTTNLTPDEAEHLAAALHQVTHTAPTTYPG